MKIIKNILFYLLSFTWGIIMSLIGSIIALILLLIGHKPIYFHKRIHFMVGDNWGGLEMGPFFITDNQPTLHIKQHECGHGIQNIIFGPFMPFLVSIPSAIRYWVREMKNQKTKYIFAIILCAVFWGVGAVMAVIGSFWWKPLVYIALIIIFYFIYIFIWLIVREIPKYKGGSFVPYDSIWFEGMATQIGENLFRYDDEKW